MSSSHRLAAALAATVLALSACADEGTDETASPQDVAATAGEAPDPPTSEDPEPEDPSAASQPAPDPAELPTVPAEAGHLHGMAIDPADGRVHLGTHVGQMVVEPDTVRRVGEATIDLMGFTVAGPNHFYASGHPGPSDDLPNPVGLIESTDGGRTWVSLSLAGSSDFHALAAGGGRVYGWDGAIRSSGDGASWQTGATDVRPASLAVGPDRPETVVATTEQGPVRSDDGGRTFAALEGAPLLVLVSWASPEALWGVAPDGAVHVSSDSGNSWQARGQTGAPPQAFAAAADGTVVVATAEHLLRSEDDGRTFAVFAHRG